jgi:hypothetical protein
MNIAPMLFCLLIPCSLFAVVTFELSFTAHYEKPLACWSVVVSCLLVVLAIGLQTARLRAIDRKGLSTPEREPNWWCFLFLSMAFSWVLAVAVGCTNYSKNMKPYYDYQNLNTYFEVDPLSVHGQQVMDAGLILFKEGSHVDTGKTMNFRGGATYCAAPIVSSNASSNSSMVTYDFWAVGKNCCKSGSQDFTCGATTQSGNSGLRLLRDQDRTFYRMAVEQAEVAYNIRAQHPVFFTWLHDAPSLIEGFMLQGWKWYRVAVGTHFLLEAFLVASAAIAFSKLANG